MAVVKIHVRQAEALQRLIACGSDVLGRCVDPNTPRLKSESELSREKDIRSFLRIRGEPFGKEVLVVAIQVGCGENENE